MCSYNTQWHRVMFVYKSLFRNPYVFCLDTPSNVEYAELVIPRHLVHRHHWRLVPNVYYSAPYSDRYIRSTEQWAYLFMKLEQPIKFEFMFSCKYARD